MILFGEGSVRKATAEFVAHYHLERDHRGLDNRLISPEALDPVQTGEIERRERLGLITELLSPPGGVKQNTTNLLRTIAATSTLRDMALMVRSLLAAQQCCIPERS